MTGHPTGTHTAAMSSRVLPRLLAALGFVVVSIAAASPASAQAGVGIDPGVLSGFPPVLPGDSLSATVRVRNPGQSPASYALSAQPLSGAAELAVDTAWVRFDTDRFELAPQEARNVRVTILVPRGVAPGDYLTLVTAQIVSAGNDQGGARVMAGVASRLRFSVVAPPETSSSGVDIPVVFGGIAVVLAIGGAGMFLLRRSALRLL